MLIVGCERFWLIARVSECQDSCDRVSGLLRTPTTTDAGSHSATAISDEPLHWPDVHHARRPRAGVSEHLRHRGWCATWFDNFGFVSLNVDIDLSDVGRKVGSSERARLGVVGAMSTECMAR